MDMVNVKVPQECASVEYFMNTLYSISSLIGDDLLRLLILMHQLSTLMV